MGGIRRRCGGLCARAGGKFCVEHDFQFLTEVADQLFSGKVLEEKIAGVFLLEGLDAQCGDREFKMFESWLDRISSWADHDGLVHCLISPMVAAKTGACAHGVSVGEVEESVAPASGLCGVDPGSAGKDAFSGDREVVGFASLR